MIGARNSTYQERQVDDYYATDPRAMDLLLEVEKFNKNVWECCSGEGHLSKRLADFGYNVKSTDIVLRNGFGDYKLDFLEYSKQNQNVYDGDIVTNPPYKHAQAFVEGALNVVKPNCKVAMFLKLTFLETKSRRLLFDSQPPKTVYVSSSRLNCAKDGNFDLYSSRAIAYAWFVWKKGYQGDTIIKWIN